MIGFLREERAYSICFSQENDTERMNKKHELYRFYSIV